MFWGLILHPNQKYSLKFEMSLHISMAVVDISTINNQIVNVIASKDNINFLICTLSSKSNWQTPLNLNFEKGSKISLFCTGKNDVHLTGYYKDNQQSNKEIENVEAKEENEKQVQKKYVLVDDKKLKRKATFSPAIIKIKRMKCENNEISANSTSKDTTKDKEEEQEEGEEGEEGEEDEEDENKNEEEEEEEEGEEEEEEEDDDGYDNDEDEDEDDDGDGDNYYVEDDDDNEDEDEDYDVRKLRSSKKTIDDSKNKKKKIKFL